LLIEPLVSIASVPPLMDPLIDFFQPHEKVKLRHDQTRALIDKRAEPPMIPGPWHGGKDWK
jgi:hypothetical protein